MVNKNKKSVVVFFEKKGTKPEPVNFEAYEQEGRNSRFVLNKDEMPDRVRFDITHKGKTRIYYLHTSHIIDIIIDITNPSSAFKIKLPQITLAGEHEWSSSESFITLIAMKSELAVKITKQDNVSDIRWLKLKNEEIISGALDNFCKKGNEVQFGCQTLMYKNDPSSLFKNLEFIADIYREGSNLSLHDQRVSIGLFSNNSHLIFTVLTMGEAKTFGLSSEPVHNYTLTLPEDHTKFKIATEYKYEGYFFFTCHLLPLSVTSDWITGWIPNSQASLDNFLKYYSTKVELAQQGAWLMNNHAPWLPVPKTETAPEFDVIWLFGGNSAAKNLRSILPVKISDTEDNNIRLEYSWRDSINQEDVLKLEGKIEADVLPRPFKNENSEPIKKDEPAFKALLKQVVQISNDIDYQELYAKVDVQDVKAVGNGKYYTIGALEFSADTSAITETQITDNHEGQAGQNPEVHLCLRSGVDQGYSRIFPSCSLYRLPVRVRYGSSTDQPTQYSKFNLAGSTELKMQSSSEAITHLLDQQDDGIVAQLSINTESRFGANLSVELSLDEERAGYRHPDILFFQARPFLMAKVSNVAKSTEGGQRLAVWRNDDPDGPQWRMPYDVATIQLPAQTVGEEMERGNRFWPEKNGAKEESYIDDKSFIKYRFSPSTTITLSPELGRRRFNTAPANLYRLLDEAAVQSFRTEMAYPVAVGFKRDSKGEPDIRMAETGSSLGQTTANLPVVYNNDFTDKLVHRLFEGQLGRWLDAEKKKTLLNTYLLHRLNNSAAKANYSARLGQLHLYTPRLENRVLSLTKGLSFEIRSHARYDDNGDRKPVPGQTPPLMNPLPIGTEHSDITNNSAGLIKEFLKEVDKKDNPEKYVWDEDGTSGGFRGGVLHTIEFPSELVAILRNPETTIGSIDSLSFSNLGATGSMVVAFDEGRTTFTVDVQNGQLSRLLKTRIGRIGIAWNRAKHIIVYERTVLPSTQFESQQKCDAHLGWPLLRKTEEYIEPIDVIRPFAKEADAEKNKTGFIDEFEFISQRIYVDSGWGEELKGEVSGYKIPLWDGGLSQADASKESESAWYYPKPRLAFVSRDLDGLAVRQWIEDPDEMVFYTNTVEGASGDPDSWDGVSGVDAPSGIFRLGVLSPEPKDWDKFISSRAPVNPRRDALRRKRFELRVKSDGAVDLQAQRSDKKIFAAIHLVSVARSAESSVSNRVFDSGNLPKDLEKSLDAIRNSADYSGKIGDITAPLDRWLKELPQRMLQFACDKTAISALIKELDQLEKETNQYVLDAINSLPIPSDPPSSDYLINKIRKETIGISVVEPETISIYADEVREYIETHFLTRSDKFLDENKQAIKKELKERFDPVISRVNDAKEKVDKGIIQAATHADEDLKAYIQKLDSVARSLGEMHEEIDNCADNDWLYKIKCHLDDIETQLDKLEKTKLNKSPYRNFAQQISTILEALRTCLSLAKKTIEYGVDKIPDVKQRIKAGLVASKDAIKHLKKQLDKLKEAIENLQSKLARKLDSYTKKVKVSICNLKCLLSDSSNEAIRDNIRKLHAHVDSGVDEVENSIVSAVSALNQGVRKDIDEAIKEVVEPLNKLYNAVTKVYVSSSKEYLAIIDNSQSFISVALKDVFDKARDKIKELENKQDDFCKALEQAKNDIETELRKVEKDVRDSVSGAVSEMFDEETRQALEAFEAESSKKINELRNEYGDTLGKVESGIKLARAIGDMPALPDLTFNVDRAEYVFDDLQKQIETSAFVARVKEIDAGLKELGINIPSTQLFDQIIPKEGIEAGFNRIIDSMGGMDFSDFFKKFKISSISRDQYRITHGVDIKTRAAWVKVEIKAKYKKRHALFDNGSFGIYTSNIDIFALREMRQNLDGRRDSMVHGKFKADWALQFGGTDMVIFKGVTVDYDGYNMSFDINPNNIEYHPSLRFISDVAKKMNDQLPPSVILLKDSRGIPVGAEAKLSTLIDSPLPNGPVVIGSLLIEGGLTIRLTNKGQFFIESFGGVGSKKTPVFVQIGWLGGGAWLSCTIQNGLNDKDKRVTTYTGSVGLALGSVRAVNIANIAKGSYSFLLFANAEFSDDGGVLRTGISVEGSARVLSIATIYIAILLQMTHSSSGKTTGKGQLNAKVKISQFYTLKVRKEVKKEFN